MKTFKAGEAEKLSRLLLRAYNGGLSYTNFQKLLRKKDIKINGVRTSKDVMLSVGDEIDVYFDGSTLKLDFDILYDDDNVLVANKPKGVTSESYYEAINAEYEGLYFCHRLDRNTDGIMIFAKNETANCELLDGFKRRTFKKIYTATVYGVVKKDEETLTAYLVKDAESGTVRVVDRIERGAVKIVTAYKVLERGVDRTKIAVELVTGRTHQIRAHMASVGHFVLGDGKYGVERLNRELKISEMQLTATELTLFFDVNSPLFATLNGKKFILNK